MSLTRAQVDAFYDRVGLSEETRSRLQQGPNGRFALEAITQLQQHSLAKIPFENLELHYSANQEPSFDFGAIFDHVVHKRRGGMCYHIHLIILRLLRYLGFDAYCTAGKINASADLTMLGRVKQIPRQNTTNYGTWARTLVLVIVGEQTYVMDASGGPFYSSVPVPLLDARVVTDMGSRQFRTVSGPVTGGSGLTSQTSWWQIQSRNQPSDCWMNVISFREVEWQPLDFASMVLGLGILNVSWYRSVVVCWRLVLQEERPIGWMLVRGDELVTRNQDKVEIVRKFYLESERVETLAEEFGIELFDDEQNAIKGTAAELKDDAFDFYG